MLLSSKKTSLLKVGARNSALSKAQEQEVLSLLWEYYPDVKFDCLWMDTPGDRDLRSSLREMDKTDFFTRDLDAALLEGSIRVAIHSAKDLPEPLPEGLQVVALTRAVDPRDMLVSSLLHGKDPLPKKAVIGTSSERREAAVKQQLPNAICKEIRGSIVSRLEQLDEGDFDAVVMPECALIRLGLTDRPRIPLAGTPAPLQGQLAVVARSNDDEMKQLFYCLDVRE